MKKEKKIEKPKSKKKLKRDMTEAQLDIWKKDPNTKAQHFALRWNYPLTDKFNQIFKAPGADWMVGQLEKGQIENILHFQFYMCFDKTQIQSHVVNHLQ